MSNLARDAAVARPTVQGGAGVVQRAYAVYEGATPLRIGPVEVLPVAEFLERLYAGRVIG